MRRHLAKFLASSSLAGAARLSRFLEYAVNETLAGNAEELKEFRLGMDVFDRPSSFDPKTDPVVRVAARQLRYKLDGYYAEEGKSDEVVITIPKGGYSARFEWRGRPEEVVESAPARVKPRRWLPGVWVPILVAVAVAVAVAWRSQRTGMPPSEPQPSIAVLPFVNQSSNPENEYFSDGLTNEVIADLSRMGGLRVIARQLVVSIQRQDCEPG